MLITKSYFYLQYYYNNISRYFISVTRWLFYIDRCQLCVHTPSVSGWRFHSMESGAGLLMWHRGICLLGQWVSSCFFFVNVFIQATVVLEGPLCNSPTGTDSSLFVHFHYWHLIEQSNFLMQLAPPLQYLHTHEPSKKAEQKKYCFKITNNLAGCCSAHSHRKWLFVALAMKMCRRRHSSPNNREGHL